jgi:hypothetical protein
MAGQARDWMTHELPARAILEATLCVRCAATAVAAI